MAFDTYIHKAKTKIAEAKLKSLERKKEQAMKEWQSFSDRKILENRLMKKQQEINKLKEPILMARKEKIDRFKGNIREKASGIKGGLINFQKGVGEVQSALKSMSPKAPKHQGLTFGSMNRKKKTRSVFDL